MDKKKQVFQLYNKGFTQAEIARELKMQRSKVNEIVSSVYGTNKIVRKGKYHYYTDDFDFTNCGSNKKS